MEKIRVYEIAKELNTSSKRLMEKLDEIGVKVKNHMSLLEDNELKALYNHIGLYKDEHKANDEHAANNAHKDIVADKNGHLEHKEEDARNKHDPLKKSGVRIVRKVEINLDTKIEEDTAKEEKSSFNNDYPKQGSYKNSSKPTSSKNRNDNSHSSYSSAGNSGLRPGYIRDKNTQGTPVPHVRPAHATAAQAVQVTPASTAQVTPASTAQVTPASTAQVTPAAQVAPAPQATTVTLASQAATVTSASQVTTVETVPATHGEQITQAPKKKAQSNKKETDSIANENLDTTNVEVKTEKTHKKVTVNVKKQTTIDSEAIKPIETVKDKEMTSEKVKVPAGERSEVKIEKSENTQVADIENKPAVTYSNQNKPAATYSNQNRPTGSNNQNRPNAYNKDGAPNTYNRDNKPSGTYNNPNRDNKPSGTYNNPNRDNKPSGTYNNPNRPAGSYNNPNNPNRPAGSYNNPNRPAGTYNKEGGTTPYNRDARPAGSGTYNNPNRSAGSYNNATRPAGTYNNNRPSTGGYNKDGGSSTYNKDARPGSTGTYNNLNRSGSTGSYNNSRPPYNKDGGNSTYNKESRPGGTYNNDRNRGGSSSSSTSDLPSANVLLGKDQRKDFSYKKIEKNNNNNDNKKDTVRPQAPYSKGKKFIEPSAATIIGQKKGVNEVLSEEFILDAFYNDSQPRNKRLQRPRRNDKQQQKPKYIPPKAVLTSITIGEALTVKELAEQLKKTSTEVIKKLMIMDVMATLNQVIDFDTATLIALEFGIKTEKAIIINDEDILFDDTDDNLENLKTRPPVVVVMGHVDHGKTSLLDAIRETKAVASEAGGITQHIGAYVAEINGRSITFLDTPGHEAFTAMRLRGAQATDIAIIVVAADDGVMPQTIEAINHAKAANVSVIVAINKIDKKNINIDRVKQELSDHDILVEDWGGDVICVPVSAKKRENIDTLLEMVLLTADILELKVDYDRQAKGTVIEAKLDKSRGALATVLVQRGTLRVGDSIVTGTTVGRIRAMNDYTGKSIKEAGPSTPVEIVGLSEVPDAGEIFYAIEDEKVAKHLAEDRKNKQRDEQLRPSVGVKLEDLFSHIQEGKLKDLNIIIKGDVQGSVEAIKQSLLKLMNEEVRVRVIHDAVGAITESDISLAQVSGAIIIGFNVRPGYGVAELAENAGVDLRLYRVIYDAIDDVKAAMNGMLEPIYKEVVLGHIEIRQIFKVSGVGTIGGAYVTDGRVPRNSSIRVVRSGIVIFDGKLSSLKRFKDDAKEVAEGYECGVAIEKFNDIKEGDVIEAYAMEEVKR
jgi:translation initiation factor IF-2